jgi:signal transduction histidine kinase
VSAAAPRAEAAGVSLRASADGPAAITRGDPVALQAAVGNLVENAIRYTPRGGAVEIAATTTGDRVAIRVDDSGPGVPVAERDAIFSPFRRGAAAKRRADAQGLGLGLSIAKRIVDRHGGDLSVGDSPAGGARFTIELARVG